MNVSSSHAELSREEIVRLDKQHHWHPFTAMRQYIDEVDPLVVDRAEGARLFDVNGRSYLDANSSWWVSTIGHNHPRIVEALCAQAKRLCHTSAAGVTHAPGAKLAEELVKAAPPGLSWAFFSDDGSTAVECAIKMSLKLWQNEGRTRRTRFVALNGAFHGETIGVTSLGGVELFRRPYAGVLMDCIHVPSPGEPDAAERAFDGLSRALESGADEIAAVVLEPRVQGATGMRMYGPEYLKKARQLCDRHGTLLVIDEVFTGYGRTGPMWACQSADVVPDIMCTAKGFTAGVMPMAATLATPRVFDAFLGDPERAFHYGHSFCANPLGSAVALEMLAVMREEQVLERAVPKAERIAAAFAAMGELPGTSHARSLGMIGAIDLAGEASYLGGAGWRAYEEARRRGAYLRPLGDVVYIAPPLNIPDADLEELLDIVRASVEYALGV